MRRALLPVAFALALVAGCRDGSYRSADISAKAGDPTAVLDLNAGITVSEGSASSAHIELHAKDGDTMPGSVESADTTVLRIETTPTDSSRYVFLGIKAGVAAVTILAKGQVARVLLATVIAAPAFMLPDAGVAVGTADGGSHGEGGSDAGSGAGGDAADSGD